MEADRKIFNRNAIDMHNIALLNSRNDQIEKIRSLIWKQTMTLNDMLLDIIEKLPSDQIDNIRIDLENLQYEIVKLKVGANE
jgi:hypothetical protein